ncbi:hypothetical protein WICPIJ_005539 [Wickerhamomyces pijperi]|uniref:Protein FYV8 n=1 Tax=Wickerhamomyces pijperi TaxID=599730 RepID=A0A9P8TLQ9_WICPI|nr:hypothetical protein WICPIJ_005539 [Wickerhamomyces pijperi]
MSSPNINREKSKRWVSNSTINYDGEDWSDEYEYSDEETEVTTNTKLNSISKLPDANLSQYAADQNSDVEETPVTVNELQQETLSKSTHTASQDTQTESTLTGTYTDPAEPHVTESETPSSSSTNRKPSLPLSQYDYSHTYNLSESDQSDEDEYKPKYTKSQRFKSQFVPSSKDTAGVVVDSLPELPVVSKLEEDVEKSSANKPTVYSFDEPEYHSDEEQEQEKETNSHFKASDDTFLKTHKQTSTVSSIEELTKLVDGYKPTLNTPDSESVPGEFPLPKDTTDIGDLPIEPLRSPRIPSPVIPTIIKQEPHDLVIPTATSSSTLTVPQLQAVSGPLSPSLNSQISEADTLHIQNANDGDFSSSSSSIREITREEFDNSGAVRAVTDEQGFMEHAYLGSLISTPDIGGVERFETSEAHRVDAGKINEILNSKLRDDTEKVEAEGKREVKGSDLRDSKFYHSIDDYVEDFTDEPLEELSEREEEREEDQEETSPNSSQHIQDSNYLSPSQFQAPTFDDTDRHYSFSSMQSTGSLSTGTYSIQSESGQKSTKVNDNRTASFTNGSIPEIPSPLKSTGQEELDQDLDEREEIQLQDEEARAEEAEEKNEMDYDDMMSLNTTMSINYGHWRPDTDTFRDQFVNSAPPPIPEIANYTVDSNGEVVKDSKSVSDRTINESDEINSSISTLVDPVAKLRGEVYHTDSNSSIPLHIPLTHSPRPSIETDSPSMFHEINQIPLVSSSSSTTLKKDKPTTYQFRKIIQSDSTPVPKKIESLQQARSDESNYDSGLSIWISYALEPIEVIPYESKVTQHVKDAYAEANIALKKNGNRGSSTVGSFIGKSGSRVLHESRDLGQVFAKGIFSRGKKIMKGLE